MDNTFILKKIRALPRGNTGSRGLKGDRACVYVVGDFENKNGKIQTRVIAKVRGEFGKHLPSCVAMKDYLHKEGENFSWDELEFMTRIRRDDDVLMLP